MGCPTLAAFARVGGLVPVRRPFPVASNLQFRGLPCIYQNWPCLVVGVVSKTAGGKAGSFFGSWPPFDCAQGRLLKPRPSLLCGRGLGGRASTPVAPLDQLGRMGGSSSLHRIRGWVVKASGLGDYLQPQDSGAEIKTGAVSHWVGPARYPIDIGNVLAGPWSCAFFVSCHVCVAFFAPERVLMQL
jgi:hypothetical protein